MHTHCLTVIFPVSLRPGLAVCLLISSFTYSEREHLEIIRMGFFSGQMSAVGFREYCALDTFVDFDALLIYIVCIPTYPFFTFFLTHLLIFSFENRPTSFPGPRSYEHLGIICRVFRRPLCKMVRPMISDRFPVCLSLLFCPVLSVTLVYCGQTDGSK